MFLHMVAPLALSGARSPSGGQQTYCQPTRAAADEHERLEGRDKNVPYFMNGLNFFDVQPTQRKACMCTASLLAPARQV
jgi:hypothetical protein